MSIGHKLSVFLLLVFNLPLAAQDMPGSSEVMSAMENVAGYFMRNYPDVGADSYVGGKKRNSKIWTRSVFYEGLLNAYRENANPDWLKYTVDWGEYHKWVSSADNEAKSHNADYQCCGQSYLQLYMMEPDKTERMEHIKMRIDNMISTGRVNYWTWVDAIQMSMPVFAMLGEITGESKYHTRMWELYEYTRNSQGGDKKCGGKPLFNESTGLWYRDADFDPPYKDKTETDKDCYWSRGNGWVYMALARIMQFTSPSEAHRSDYEADFKMMSKGLMDCQREDGAWNVSLAAPTNFGAAGSEGPEMTGTSLFVGGMAYGVRVGLLDGATYLPVIVRGWESMRNAVHESTGQVGYLQGTGSKPEDGGVITYNSIPDFEDFGYGCWLWGASEVHALASKMEDEQSGLESINIGGENSREDDVWYDLMGRKVMNPRPGNLYIHNRTLVRL